MSWIIATHDHASGDWVETGNFDNPEDAKSGFKKGAGKTEYVLWGGDWPTDKAALHALVQQHFDMNEGNMRSIIPGVEMDIKRLDSSSCGCPGRCFCVHEGGKCECQTKYCNEKVCWWVKCPGSC